MRWRHLLYALAAVLVFGAACGDDDGPALPASAGSPAADGDAGFVLDAEVVQHHWQALIAIRASDLEDAGHHVDHIIDAVGGAHLAAMQEVAELLDAGAVHDAEHEIEGMLAGQAELDLSEELLHLQMALDALTDDETSESAHHLQHFVAASEGHEAEEGEEILATIEAGNHPDARERLASLIVELTGETGAHDDADDHEADEGHARVVTVIMSEFAYDPDEIHVKVGETVRLVLVNEGAVLHDITTDQFHGTVEAAEAGGHDDAAHDGHDQASEFHAALESGGTTELVFVAEQAGRFELFCSVPGHRELGMTATLVVEEG